MAWSRCDSPDRDQPWQLPGATIRSGSRSATVSKLRNWLNATDPLPSGDNALHRGHFAANVPPDAPGGEDRGGGSALPADVDGAQSKN